MRKITENAINAFENFRGFRSSNTEVVINQGRAELYLFDNLIATLSSGLDGRKLRITDAGWQTVTTKERLNGLSGVSIAQKDYQWYLNGKPWNGDWIVVEPLFQTVKN